MANGERCVMAILTTMKPKSPALCSDLCNLILFAFAAVCLLRFSVFGKCKPKLTAAKV